MSTELAVDAFWDALERSGILPSDKLHKLEPELLATPSGPPSSRSLAEELVTRGILTRWQADKLLEGKYRGFVLGPYRLLTPLGRGGMGLVYLAEHTMMRRRCAIKVLPAQLASDPGVVERFYREAQAVAALDHPNIVRAYDVSKSVQERSDEVIHYLVMEFVDGRDMQRKVEEKGVLGFREAAELIRQAAEGLAHAHAVGIIHRDVKPANLLVDRNGTVRLLDLGLATFFNDPDEAAAAAEQGRTVLGTADYLAPEQAVDSNKIDARADVYSLGMTFYFLLTGHAPFPTGTIVERLMAHQTRSPEPVEKIRPDAPLGLMAILHRMIARKPDQRYQSATEVAEALAAWLKDNPADSNVLRGLGRLESVMRLAAQRAASGHSSPKAEVSESELDFAPIADEPPPSATGSGIRGRRSSSTVPPVVAPANEPSPKQEKAEASPAKLPNEGPSNGSGTPQPAPLPAGEPSVDDLMLADSMPTDTDVPVLGEPLSSPSASPLAGAAPAKPEEEANLLQSPWVWLGAIVPVAGLVILLVMLFRPSSQSDEVAASPTVVSPALPAAAPPLAAPAPAPESLPSAPSPASNPAPAPTPEESPGNSPPPPAATERPDPPAPKPAGGAPPKVDPAKPPKPGPDKPSAGANQPASKPAQPATPRESTPKEAPRETPPASLKDAETLLADMKEVGFTLDSFDKSPTSPINLMVRDMAEDTARRAGLTPSADSQAVMKLSLRADPNRGVVMAGVLNVTQPGGKSLEVWQHDEVVAPVADFRKPGMLKVLRSGLISFFNKFRKARSDAQEATGAPQI